MKKYLLLLLMFFAIFPSSGILAVEEKSNNSVTVEEAEVLLVIASKLGDSMTVEYIPEKKYFAFSIASDVMKNAFTDVYEGKATKETVEAWESVANSFINISSAVTESLDSTYTVTLTNFLNKENMLIKAVDGELIYNILDDK